MIGSNGPYNEKGDPVSAKEWNDVRKRVERLERIKSKTLKVTSTTTGISIDSFTDNYGTPFMARILREYEDGTDYITFSVGEGRGKDDYPFFDTVYQYDLDTKGLQSIEKTTVETVEIDTSGAVTLGNGVLFYEINAGTATLNVSTDIPDFQAGTSDSTYQIIAWFKYNSETGKVFGLVQDLKWNPVVAQLSGDSAPHPFDVTYTSGTTYSIGKDRGESFRLVRDIIDIYDRDGSLLYSIEKVAAEPVISANGSIIYYKISRTAGGTWSATPLSTATWPPVSSSPDQDSIYWPIATTGVGGTGTVGQLQHSDISCSVRQMQPSFAAFRHSTGVNILGGDVHCGLGGTTAVTGATALNGESAWIKVVSAPDTTPVVTATVQVGAFPGYQQVAAGTTTRNYRLGEWSAVDVWTPHHEGDLFLGTEYQPDIVAAAQHSDAQDFKMIMGEATSVGATKDLFFEGRESGVAILNGDVESITDIEEVKLGGVSVDIDLNIITGVSITGQVLTFTTTDRASETDSGLVQDLSDAAGTPIAITIPTPTPSGTLAEGPGIDITEAPANTFTITSLLDDNGTGVVITDGAAGAAHVASLDYSVIWSHLKEGPGVDVTVVGDDATVSSLLAGTTSINITAGAAGAAHTVDTIEQMSITTDANGLMLDGDELAPGNDEVYSTNGAGVKGWNNLPDRLLTLLDEGEAIDLVQAAPGGAVEINVLYQKSIVLDTAGGNNHLELDGDVAAPDEWYHYGTDENGDKGWQQAYLSLVSTGDTTPNWLGDKISYGVANEVSINNVGANETVYIDVLYQNSIALDGVANALELVSDEADPGANTFYGCDNATGATGKKWLDFTQITAVTDTRLNNDGSFEKKTRTGYLYAPGTESAWTPAGSLPTTTCSS